MCGQCIYNDAPDKTTPRLAGFLEDGQDKDRVVLALDATVLLIVQSNLLIYGIQQECPGC